MSQNIYIKLIYVIFLSVMITIKTMQFVSKRLNKIIALYRIVLIWEV